MSLSDAFVGFFIPGDPRGQGRPRATIRGKHAGVYTDDKTASYQNLVALAAREAMAGRPPFDGPVTLTLQVFLSVPKSASKNARAQMLASTVKPTKKPDASNCAKACEDGMNGIVFRDDSQIVTLFVLKRYSDVPGVQVTVTVA